MGEDNSYVEVASDTEKLFGEDALRVRPDAEFDLFWPMRRGRLNLHKGVGGSLSAVLHDLKDIWEWAIREHLGTDPAGKSAILIIPDVYVAEHVKRTVEMLFTELGFQRLFLHVESVCAAFGAGMASACVVDIGEQKTLITCVDDGISLKQTRLLMEFGGADLTQLMRHLLKDKMPWNDARPSSVYDSRLLDRIKQSFCHLNLDHCGPIEGKFVHSPPGEVPREFALSVGEEAMIVVLGAFCPDMLVLTGPKGSHLHAPQVCDPQDPHDDLYILQTQRKRGDAEFDEGDDEDGLPTELKDPIRLETIPIPQAKNLEKDSRHAPKGTKITQSLCSFVYLRSLQVLGVDAAILQSVERCESEDVKRKMLSQLLLVGGGLAHFPGVATWLRNRLAMQMPKSLRGEPIDIATRAKELPPDSCVWRGASIMSQLDTSHELWIPAVDWRRYGSKILRERAVFGW
ncbi:actin-related protein 8-like [Tropilaelaps mercedesae]|uniref:Actin-related protein 8-like n=1 Tax=Tropilaelaps mercedesae TaxID=418985 RepID=A0A1V9XER6_9ACAR|nr:actin-related protein 8-like [Tropilaelaps mercedesae]